MSREQKTKMLCKWSRKNILNRNTIYCRIFIIFLLMSLFCTMFSFSIRSAQEFHSSETPVACFTWSPIEPQAGAPVLFNASCSYCSDDGLLLQQGKAEETNQNIASKGNNVVPANDDFDNEEFPLESGDEGTVENTISTEEPVRPSNGKMGDAGESSYIVTYYWEFGDGNTSTEMNPTHIFMNVGEYTVSLMVIANSGEANTTTAQLTVNPDQSGNRPPIAEGAGPYFGWINEPVYFDGSSSTDPDGTIVSYRWEFGDGTIITGRKPIHVYSQVGLYTVSLTVTDNSGEYDTSTTKACIVGDGPVAYASGPYFGFVNQTLFFNGSQSYEPNGNITKYLWDFGDNSNGTGKTLGHLYKTKGIYIVTLTVFDNNGLTNTNTTSASITDSIRPTKPEVTGPLSGESETEYTYRAVSYDVENDSISYVFDWGDNSNFSSPFFPSGTVISTSHTWTIPGTYTIRVFAVNTYVCSSETTELIVVIGDHDSFYSSRDTGEGKSSLGEIHGFGGLFSIIGLRGNTWMFIGILFAGLVLVINLILRYKKNRF